MRRRGGEPRPVRRPGRRASAGSALPADVRRRAVRAAFQVRRGAQPLRPVAVRVPLSGGRRHERRGCRLGGAQPGAASAGPLLQPDPPAHGRAPAGAPRCAEQAHYGAVPPP